MMSKNYIFILILKFYNNSIPQELQQKFRHWLVSSRSYDEKEEALFEIWENNTTEADEQTSNELRKIWKRIHHSENLHSLSIYRKLARIAGILLLPLIGAALMYLLQPDSPVFKSPELIECFVPYGEQQQIQLSDGTEVWLNAGSLLIYEKEFKGDTRTLYLNGEASFSVTKNPEKPFIVKTQYIDVEVLGTTFNVQSYPQAENTIATLEQGSVKISLKDDHSEYATLFPNEQLIFDHATHTFIKRKVDAARECLWREGFIAFSASNFDEIVKTIERKFNITINYETQKFDGRTFTIRFSPEEDLDQVLDILKDIVGFKYRVKDQTVYIY